MNIYESIAAVMAEVPAIGKDRRNKEQGFQYRGIEDVMNVLQPLLSKHKVFIVPEVLEQKREERVTKKGSNMIYSILRIKYTFYAEDGSHVEAIVVGEGMDTADKASNKSLAVGMKYALFQVFCIPTEEMVDPDSETPEASSPKGNYPPAMPQGTLSAASGDIHLVPQDLPPEPAPNLDPDVRCNRCTKRIIPINYKGELWPVVEIVKRSRESYRGATLCWGCMKELASTSTSTSTGGEPDENAG